MVVLGLLLRLLGPLVGRAQRRVEEASRAVGDVDQLAGRDAVEEHGQGAGAGAGRVGRE